MLTAPALLLGRLAMAFIFVFDGYDAIVHSRAVADFMSQGGAPPALLPIVIITELGGGALVAAGLLTRWSALALCGFCLLTALMFHADWSDAEQWINFQKNLGMAGGFLILAAWGPGPWSLDALASRRARR